MKANLNTLLISIVGTIVTAGTVGLVRISLLNSEKLAAIAVQVSHLETAFKETVTRREYDNDTQRMQIEIDTIRVRQSKIEAEQARIDSEIIKLKSKGS